MKEKYKNDVNIQLINAKLKRNPEVIDLLENEIIHSNHVIGTSYISDGINFNNSEWNDLFIIENDSLTICEVYQLTKRFRKVNDLNIIFFARERKDADEAKPIKFSYLNIVPEYRKLQYKEFEKVLSDLVLHNPGDALIQIDGIFEFNGKYSFNNDFLKLINFENYNWKYKIYKHIFYGALEYYFNVGTITNADNYNSDDKLKITELNKFVKKNIKYLISKADFSICETNDEDLFNLLDVENELDKIINNNREYFKKINSRIKLLLSLNGNPIDCLLVKFERRIENLKIKKVLTSTETILPNATEIITKKWVDKFVDWLLIQDIFHDYNGKKYFFFDDVIEKLKIIPQELLNESNLFFNYMTNEVKLKKYLRNIDRFKFCRIRLDDGERSFVFLVK